MTEKLREIAQSIAEALESCGFDDVTDGSGYYIIREFADGTDRAVDVYKSTDGGTPHYAVCLSYEDEQFNYVETADLTVEGLAAELEKFYLWEEGQA